MVEDEITCIKTDDSDTITHVGLKKGSTQPVSHHCSPNVS